MVMGEVDFVMKGKRVYVPWFLSFFILLFF